MRRIIRSLLAAALLVAAAPVPSLSAQVGARLGTPVAVGDRVRVRAAGAKGEFQVTEIGPQGFTILDVRDQSSRTLPVETLRKTWVDRGRHSHLDGAGHGFKKGAKWGFIVGAAVGAVVPMVPDLPAGPAGAILLGPLVAVRAASSPRSSERSTRRSTGSA